MRTATLLCASLVCVGAACNPDEPPDASYALVVDAASITARGSDGQLICPTGTLSTYVSAAMFHGTGRTGLATGHAPEWRSTLFGRVDTAAAFARGVTLHLLGDCDGAPVELGSVTIHPRRSRIHDGAVIVVGFGSAVRVRMHFRLQLGRGYDDGSWIDDGGWPDCVGLDCGWIDDDTWVDDEGSWVDDGGGSYDDGSGGGSDGGGGYDDGGGSDDGDGGGGYDDGGGSDDGDGGYDDGGGYDDDDGGGSDDGDYMDDGGGSDDGGGDYDSESPSERERHLFDKT